MTSRFRLDELEYELTLLRLDGRGGLSGNAVLIILPFMLLRLEVDVWDLSEALSPWLRLSLFTSPLDALEKDELGLGPGRTLVAGNMSTE